VTQEINDQLLLIGGKSAAGKSASLMAIDKPEGVMYLNCESGKRLPFRAKFKQFTITDPMQTYEAFDAAETMDDIHTIVVDSQTYLMDMYESNYVINSTNTMKAWGDYAQFFKVLMLTYVARSSKNVIFTAHTLDTLNEAEMLMETKVPVKGSLKNLGIESYFSLVMAAKKVPVKHLDKYSSDLLTITPEEEALGFKYVFQTKLTKETVNERLRGPMGLFSNEETFIDNNVQLVMNRLHTYYD
jgi:AAA domain